MPGPRGPMGGGRTVEKPANFGNVMGKLVHYCRNYLPVIIIALVLGAAGTICQIIGPDKLKDMTNEIVKGLPAIVNGKPVMNSVDFNAVGRIAWLLVALYVGYAVLSYVQSWMMANVTQRTAQRLRESISVKINKLPLKYFDKVSYGDVLSRITNDVDAIGQTLGQSLGSLITSATLFVGALVMMFYNNVIMTLCAIGASILGLIIMMVIMKSSQKYFARQQMALGDVNGHIEEMYAGHLIVKAYNGEADSIRRFEKYNADLYESGWKSQFLSGLMMPLMNFVGNFGYVIVCVVGAALAMDGKIEFGVIVAFMMYIRLFTQPLSQFAQAFQNLQRCAAAAERVFGFLEEPEMDAEPTKAELGVADAAASTARTDSGKLAHRGTRANATAGMTASQRSQLLGYDAAGNPRTVRGDVEFSHVRFGYEPADHPRLLGKRLRRPESRHRRSDRRRQNHHGQPADALLRDLRRLHLHRRHRHHFRAALERTRPVLHGPAGYMGVPWHRARKHRLLQARRHRRADRLRMQGRRTRPLRALSAAGLRHRA